VSGQVPFRRRTRRRWSLVGAVVVLLLAAVAAGCGGDDEQATTEPTTTGKVIIGAFQDGGLTPFKDKIIPLAKEAGFDIEFLEDQYDVTLEKWFADAQNEAGQYDVYLLDDPWVPQFAAANVLEDLGAAGVDGEDSDWLAPMIDMGYWPPREGPRVKGFEDADPKLIALPFVGDLQTMTYRNDVFTEGAPQTWDELIEKGKEAVANGTIKYPVVFRGVASNPIVTSWYPVFLSFDVDFLDPSIAPGVGTTVPGGPNYREAQLVMEMIADNGRMASLDIMELNPVLDARNATANLVVDLVESLFGKSTLMRD